MFQFKSTDSISKRVTKVVESHVETQGANWLLTLGYQSCNDYAEQVKQIVSFSSNNEFIRFETVARVIRSYKARLRREQANNAAQDGQGAA